MISSLCFSIFAMLCVQVEEAEPLRVIIPSCEQHIDVSMGNCLEEIDRLGKPQRFFVCMNNAAYQTVNKCLVT